jgi:hypothetical protein
MDSFCCACPDSAGLRTVWTLHISLQARRGGIWTGHGGLEFRNCLVVQVPTFPVRGAFRNQAVRPSYYVSYDKPDIDVMKIIPDACNARLLRWGLLLSLLVNFKAQLRGGGTYVSTESCNVSFYMLGVWRSSEMWHGFLSSARGHIVTSYRCKTHVIVSRSIHLQN